MPRRSLTESSLVLTEVPQFRKFTSKGISRVDISLNTNYAHINIQGRQAAARNITRDDPILDLQAYSVSGVLSPGAFIGQMF
jgi:hypothetical protein